MTTPRAPIMEYPGRAKAVIEPSEILSRKARIPNRCVMCYFMEVMKKLIDEGVMTPIGKLDGEGIPPDFFTDINSTVINHFRICK